METPKPQFSLKQMLSRLRFGGGKHLSPDRLWQIILGSTVVCIAIIMTFAYVTYDWATTIDPSTTTSKKAHDGLSVSELKDVTEVYKNKEIESEGLLRTPPHAPEYRKVRVVALQPDIVSASTTQINSSSSVSR